MNALVLRAGLMQRIRQEKFNIVDQKKRGEFIPLEIKGY
jgi:hypothetical protein